MSRWIAVLFGLSVLLAGPVHADRLGKGRSLVLVGIGGHRGQFASEVPPILGFSGALFRNETGEVGGTIDYYRFLSEHWTLGISGGYHTSRTKTDRETTETHSYTLRIGGDRYAFVEDRVALYAGPGVFFTRGRQESTLLGAHFEQPNTTEVGLDGRIGMHVGLREHWALFGHIGQVLSHTSAKAPVGKISWWSSATQGSFGLAFDF